MRRLKIHCTIFALLALLACGCGRSEDEEDDCEDCESPAGLPRSATPYKQDLPPVPGTGPVFSSVSWNGFAVSWTAATDDKTSASKLEYQLVRASTVADLESVGAATSITGGGIALAWSAGTVATTVSGRAQVETRAYTVLVRDEAGNVAVYPPQSVTTSSQPAPTPRGTITVSDAGGSQTQIAWAAADAPGDAGVTYLIVFAPSPEAIDTVDEAEALASTSRLPWLPPGVLAITTSTGGNAAYAFVAVVARNSSGQKALYAPVSTQF